MKNSWIHCLLFMGLIVVQSSCVDRIEQDTELIPAIQEKIRSIPIDHYFVQIIHIENKPPLSEEKIREWVIRAMQRMDIEENHPDYAEQYQLLFNQYSFQSANIFRRLTLQKSDRFYILSQKPLTVEDLQQREKIFQDNSPDLETYIDDYHSKKNYLVDHANRSILESDVSAWSEVQEALCLLVPERALTPFLLLSEERSKLKKSLQKVKEPSSSEGDEIYEFSYTDKQGIPRGQKIYYQKSEKGSCLRKIVFYANRKITRQSVWRDFQFDPLLKIPIAKTYTIFDYVDNNTRLEQKEYHLHSYRINDPIDDLQEIQTILQKYYGYQLLKKIPHSPNVEPVGMIGVDVFQ